MNDDEFSQRFELRTAGSGTGESVGEEKYYMAATFANDHQLKIISKPLGSSNTSSMSKVAEGANLEKVNKLFFSVNT